MIQLEVVFHWWFGYLWLSFKFEYDPIVGSCDVPLFIIHNQYFEVVFVRSSSMCGHLHFICFSILVWSHKLKFKVWAISDQWLLRYSTINILRLSSNLSWDLSWLWRGCNNLNQKKTAILMLKHLKNLLKQPTLWTFLSSRPLAAMGNTILLPGVVTYWWSGGWWPAEVSAVRIHSSSSAHGCADDVQGLFSNRRGCMLQSWTNSRISSSRKFEKHVWTWKCLTGNLEYTPPTTCSPAVGKVQLQCATVY